MTDETFEHWARTYGDTLFRVAFHALASHPDAEDVVQTVLLKLYQEPRDFESEEHVKRWLLRVTVNEARRLLRSPWHRRRVPLEDWDAPAPAPAESDVLDQVMALPGKYRVSIYLYYYEGLSVREVAQAMGAGESTVQTWLQRAREKLRLALSEEKEETGYARP